MNRTIIHIHRGIAVNIISFGMSTYTAFDMLITGLSIHWLKHLHLRPVLVICQNILQISSLGRIFLLMVIMTLIEKISSLNKFNWCIKWYKNSWKNVNPSTRQDMTCIVLITISKLEMKFGFTLSERGLKEKVKIWNQLDMDLLRFIKRLITMPSVWICLIWKCMQLLMLRIWDYMILLWFMIKEIMFRFLP